MPNIIDAKPYFFICKSCGNRFQRNIRLGIYCPHCKSLKVVKDRTILK